MHAPVQEPKHARELAEVNLRHAQKLEALGRLAAGVAHEINTPIQFIGDNVSFVGDALRDLLRVIDRLRLLVETHGTHEACEMASAVYDDADVSYIAQEGPQAVKNALEGVARVSHIVQAMKSLSHNDRGQRSLADLNAAIENSLVVARGEYKYVADVVTDLGRIPPVPCYLDDIHQVLLNLIINAAHAIADKVEGTNQRGRIGITTREDGDAVEISISDTGTGIPPLVQARMFEPFFTTKEVGRGTGQGLALARAVAVDKHRGSLTFETEVGKGTTFHLRLPLEWAATQDLCSIRAL